MAAILVLFAACAGAASASTNFIAGADVSLLSLLEKDGVLYKDKGVAGNALQILKNHGVNTIRLRLFTSSAAQAAADPYDYGNNLAYTQPLAVQVKSAGLRLLLDFHYSDTWADPGHQATPSAWTNLTFTQLVQQMRSYNSNTIASLAAAGAMPDYVQVGNEITGGFLWPDGAVSGSSNASWANFAQLLNAAIGGVKDAASAAHLAAPRIIIHIDRGGDWAGTQWFFDNLLNEQVPFDIIGESYYPFYHGPLDDAADCLTNAALRYGKPVLVAETAMPWTNTDFTTNIYGYAPDTNDQVRFTVNLTQVVEGIPDGLGAGICWWAAEYQAADDLHEAGYNTTSFFAKNGNLLPVADVFGQMDAPTVLTAKLKGAALTLQWPLSATSASLVVTTNLIPIAQWTAVTNLSQASVAGYSVTVPTTGAPTSFYTLH